MKEWRRNDREIALLTKSIVSYERFSASGQKEEIVQHFKHFKHIISERELRFEMRMTTNRSMVFLKATVLLYWYLSFLHLIKASAKYIRFVPNILHFLLSER